MTLDRGESMRNMHWNLGTRKLSHYLCPVEGKAKKALSKELLIVFVHHNADVMENISWSHDICSVFPVYTARRRD
jgi:hypothetical protein